MTNLYNTGSLYVIHFNDDEYYSINVQSTDGKSDHNLREGDVVLVTNFIFNQQDLSTPCYAHVMHDGTIYEIDFIYLNPLDVAVTRT